MVKIIGYIDNDGTFHEEERTTPVTTNSIKKIPTTAPSVTQVSKPKTVSVEPTVKSTMTEAPAMSVVAENNKTAKQEEPKTNGVINADGYEETDKKYGDYKYHDYLNKKDYKIYKKDGKSYYYDEKRNRYVDMDESIMISPEEDKKQHEEAIRNGFVDNNEKKPTKMADQVALDTSDLTDKEKEKYTKSLIRQEKKKDKDISYVRRGGAGISGFVGELQNAEKNIDEGVIEPISRAPASYQYGKLNQELSQAYYNQMMGNNNEDNVAEIQHKIDLFNQFNRDVVEPQNINKYNTIYNNLVLRGVPEKEAEKEAQKVLKTNQLDEYFKNLPNQVSGMVEGVKGAGVGGTIGAIGGGTIGFLTTKDPSTALLMAEKGAKLLGGSGYVAGQAKNTFELEAGAEYQALLEMGVPEDIAKTEALKVGTANALVESGESILDLVTLGKSSLAMDKLKEGLIKKYGLEALKSWGVSYATNVASEAGEEAIQEGISIQGEKNAAKKAGIKRDNSQDLNRIVQSAKSGGFSALFSGGATRTFGIAGNTAKNTMINQINNSIQNKNNNFALSDVTSKQSQSTNQVNQNANNNIQETTKDKTITIDEIGEMGQDYFENLDNQNNQPIQNQPTTLKDSATEYGYKGDSQELANIDNSLQKRGITARFDSSLFDNNNTNAIWINENGQRQVIFNPNVSENTIVEEIATHELTHDLMSSENSKNTLKAQRILDYVKTLDGYNEARQNLEQTYSQMYDVNSKEFQNLIDEETVADVLGKKLGNQEFVNQITNTNPSLARRIYNWVIDKLDSVVNSGGKVRNEKLFWQNVKNNFEKAYNMEYANNTSNSKYSFTKVANFDLNEYNNAKEVELPIGEYNRVRATVNDKTNGIKKGINEITIYDDYTDTYKDYSVYYRGTDDFKIVDVNEEGENYENDETTKRFSRGNESTGTRTRNNQQNNVEVNNTKKTANVYGLSDVNKRQNSTTKQSNTEINRNKTDEGLDNSSFSIKENNDIRDRAKKELGTTTNLNEAGYLTNDGEYLDFSGKKQGASGGQRQMDHREISDIYSDSEYSAAEKKYSNMGSATAILQDFIDRGNIRLNGTGVEIATAPTQQQYDKLYDYLEHVQRDNGEVFIDLDTESKNRQNLEYSEKTSVSKMIKDIKEHYSESVDNQVMKDNKGRQLSKQQQEYFKDVSKYLKDENGNVLTMYHGTPSGDFNTFKPGSYFSPRPEYATGYENTWASSISSGKKATAPRTYEVYLNIKNPFTLQDAKAKQIYIDEYIKGGNSSYFDPYTDYTKTINNMDEIDWVEGEDLKEWLNENHPEYDGLILDEGGDGGYGEAEYRWRGKSYVPFSANQIKNVDNKTPTSNADIRYKNKNNTWNNFLNENIKDEGTKTKLKDLKYGSNEFDNVSADKEVKVLESVPKETKKPLKERARETVKKFTRDFISKGEAVENLARKQKNPALNHQYDRLGIVRGEAQEHIGTMQRDLDLKPRKNFTDANGKKSTMSLNGIREDAKTHNIPETTLNQYLAEYRNVDTAKQGKPILNKSAEASLEAIQRIESEHPEIKRIAGNVWTFERNQLQDRVQSGLISEQFAKELLENNPHYVRVQRDVKGKRTTNTLNDTKRGVEVNRQIDTLKGSDADILPIMESIAKYTEQVQQSMRMNQFGQELAKTLGVGTEDSSINSFTDEESFGVNPNLLQDDGNGNYTLTVFNDGVATVVPIDQGLYESLTPNKTIQTLENDETFKKITYAPKKVSEMFRAVTTNQNPIFMFTNAFKDIGDAPFNSKYTGEFIKAYTSTQALRQVAGNGVYNQLYEAAGGKQNSYFNNGEFVDKTQTKAQKVKDKLLMPIEKGNDIVESVPRMAEFIATIKANGYEVNADGELVVKNKNKATKSANDVLNEALYNAAEVTTNFKRGGDVAKMLNRNGVTFLNASIQGFDKQIRNFTQVQTPKEAVMLLTKALIFGIAPTMLNDAMWDDDDEYEELQDYLKDNYYLFKGKDGQWIRIPKGRAMSVIGGAFRRAKNYAKGDKDAFKGFGEFAANQVAPNSVVNNNIFAPLSQVKNNKSWSGNKIISDSMSKRPTEQQYNEKTDKISIALGKAIKDLPLPEEYRNFKSPLAIHYLLDQYTGVFGDTILPMFTEKSSSKYNPLIAPFINKFTADSVYSNKSVSEYYDMKNEIETQKNSTDATPLDVAKNSYMTSRNYALSDLYKEQKQIQSDSSLSKSEKYDKAREKQKEINKTAKQIVKDVENAEEHEYYVKIGDYYYKKVIEDGEVKYKRDTSKKIPTDKYALYDYYKEKYEKSKEGK